MSNPVTGPLSIGVVVIGRNEGERLVRCLRSLAPFAPATVYVDSGSTDGSRDVARAAGVRVVELDLSLPFTAARARNAGADALLRLAPDIAAIQFVDGDCKVAPGWIDAAGTFLANHPAVAVVCGRRRERFPNASFLNALCDAEWNTPVGEAMACGGDSLVRRGAFEAVGGFDPTVIAGEEPEFCHRVRAGGGRVWRLDAEMTVHDAAMTHLSQWWRRTMRTGFGYAQVWSITRRRGAPLYGRELARALGWTIVPALLALAAAPIIGPVGLLLAPALYLLQVARLAMRSERTGAGAWQEAALLVAGKLAEAVGAVRFARRALAGRTGGTIFYK